MWFRKTLFFKRRLNVTVVYNGRLSNYMNSVKVSVVLKICMCEAN